jgi:sugar phosphate permease
VALAPTVPPPPETSAPARAQRRFPFLLRVFEPAPSLPAVTSDPAQIQDQYRRWRMRVLIASIAGYAMFYLVRKNLGIAMPMMSRSVAEGGLGITKTGFGLFLTMHGLLYGVSKFANGFFADRCNARTFLVAGLAASAALNGLFGSSSGFAALGVFWMLNGWFQGMGFPPCARLMTHWFSPKELATKMSIWNASTNIGAGLAVVLCGYLAVINWRLCFFVPALLAALACVALFFALPDTPPSVGLPEVAGTETKPTADGPENLRSLAARMVFRNPYIWLVSMGTFFVYVVRYALLDWGPTMLTETRGIKLTHAGWLVAAFEISGMTGAIIAGWMADRFWGGRCIRVCFLYMACAGVSVLLFWKCAGQSILLNTLLLCTTGFFIYGPQSLVGIAAANLATKRAAATAIGLTGLFSYASTVLSGWGLGKLVQTYGWNAGFAGMLIVCVIGAILFAIGWPAKAHGYETPDAESK